MTSQTKKRNATRNRLFRYAHEIGEMTTVARSIREKESTRLRAIRDRATSLQRGEPDRLTKTSWPVTDLNIKSKYVTRTYSYTDNKGEAPSYYASRSKAFRMIATHQLQKGDHESSQRKREAMRRLIRIGTGHGNGSTSSTLQSRFHLILAERTKVSVSGFKNQQIKISVGTDNGERAFKEITAMVKGNLAVHKRGGDPDAKGYVITHIPTGLIAGWSDNLKRGKEIIAKILRAGWDLEKIVQRETEKEKKAYKLIKYMMRNR